MGSVVDEFVLDKELNKEQSISAKQIDGPMLILAGAGSGKTRAITYKIAHLVSYYHVETERILAVTFTNKAAKEMKQRIQKLLDSYLPFNWMGTFHSICLKILRLSLSKDFVNKIMGNSWYNERFSIYDDEDQKRILKAILKEDLGDNYEPSEVKKVHGAISRYKNKVLFENNSIKLQTPEVALMRASFADEERMARYYKEYQKRLLESNAMDFDDLLFNTVLILQKVPQLAYQLSEHFQYVVVDEYQDTNDVQYELLKFLINKNKNVTVVGDDDQSIYGWRGANIKIIRDFHRDFHPVTIVKLERNYRSTSNIVKGAGSVIANNSRPKEMEKNVFSIEEPGDLIRVRHLLDDRNEAKQIANTISASGSEFYSQTAIFYRTNAQSRVIEKALNDNRIPSVIFGGTRFWDRKEIKDILSYLRLLSNEKDDIAHLRVINTPSRSIGKTTVESILVHVRNGEGSFWELLLRESNSSNKAAPKLKAFTDLIIHFKNLIKEGETPLPILVERIILDISYKEFLRKEDELSADERIANLDEMINAIREFDEDNPHASLEDFLQDISLLTDGDKKIDTSKGMVTLMTIHMAKGLEFDTVHIAGCDEGIFPLIRSSSQFSLEQDKEQMEEERRLFYVGCTRAKKKLYLYHALRRFYQGTIRPFVPSRFLKELDSSVVEFTPCIDDNQTYDTDSHVRYYNEAPVGLFNKPSFTNPSKNIYGKNLYGGYNKNYVPLSVKKNDKRIVYRNPIKVKVPEIPKGPRVVYDEFSENPYRNGVRVRHSKYGVGVITNSYGVGENARVDIRFNGETTTRTIIIKYASLEILG